MGFAFRSKGDYRPLPGPNSNTFVAAVMDAIPEIRAALPPTALGKDYPYDGRWLRRTPSGTGLRLTLGGYAGLALAWVEGIRSQLARPRCRARSPALGHQTAGAGPDRHAGAARFRVAQVGHLPTG